VADVAAAGRSSSRFSGETACLRGSHPASGLSTVADDQALEGKFLRVANCDYHLYCAQPKGETMKTYTKQDVEKVNPKSLIGKTGLMTLDDLTVGVNITDARVRFGHIDLLVEPINGSGEKWVEKHRVTTVTK
jgi:hypothetical protein